MATRAQSGREERDFEEAIRASLTDTHRSGRLAHTEVSDLGAGWDAFGELGARRAMDAEEARRVRTQNFTKFTFEVCMPSFVPLKLIGIFPKISTHGRSVHIASPWCC